MESFALHDNILFRLRATRNRGTKSKIPWLPTAMVATVLSTFHDHPMSGHFGIQRTMSKVRRRFWWPEMRATIENYIRSCQKCKKFNIVRQQFLGSFILGASLVLLRPTEHLDVDYICRTIEKSECTILDLVPTSLLNFCEYFQQKFDSNSLKSLSRLELITVGGEQLQGKIVKNIFNSLSPNCSLLNIYAPAECTISTMHYQIKPLDDDDEKIPEIVSIGRCFPDRKVAVLDSFGQPILPDGRSVGEIFVGGVEILNGYLNQPEESARVLVRLPERDGLFYRANDLGKINTKGELVFVGRADFQVKLRGQRIELGEIESVMIRFSSEVNNCVLRKMNHHGEVHLVAYIQTKAPLDIHLLSEECLKHLPLYMVPSLFVLLDSFPLNPNVKLERKSLLHPDFSFRRIDDR